jgi:uracil-DNA glycosylase
MNKFPFGSVLRKVEQESRSPKKVFVLGVYASAVHAKWFGPDNKVKVKAMAVASEPYIFWKGDRADNIIKRIKVPGELGHLEPADARFNGPSGKELDKSYLTLLGLTRSDVWLCDIVPYTRINPNQKTAIDKHYKQIVKYYNLPECTIPYFRKSDLIDGTRRVEILKELEESQAKILILLGDLPIKHFLFHYSDDKKSSLEDFGNEINEYGELNPVSINNRLYKVLPLVHPRQAGKLGRHDKKWHDLHEEWIRNKASALKIG